MTESREMGWTNWLLPFLVAAFQHDDFLMMFPAVGPCNREKPMVLKPGVGPTPPLYIYIYIYMFKTEYIPHL